MKKSQKAFATALAVLLCIITLVGCSTNTGSLTAETTSTEEVAITESPSPTDIPTPIIYPTITPAITPEPTSPPADISPSKVDYITTIWTALEITFTSSVNYSKPLYDAELDVVFTSPTGITMKMPGFWDGSTTWKVRFAPTMCGIWTYKTICTDSSNAGLNGLKGKVGCNAYKGNLEIYKHGFVKTEPNTRYFMYADGKAFFYLGDTHWSMPSEQINYSGVAGIASQFKYIVDKRVEQGFTVYQSEPIGASYNFDDGVSMNDIYGLQDMDARFKYIADKGLVHANAQFFFVATLLNNPQVYTKDYLAKLSRMWVARYGAYPVMWTTAQECDNDFYAEKGQSTFTAENNPWKYVATKMNEYDPYKHPLTAHQEYASMTAPLGVNATTSAFRDVVGHSWYGVQWTPSNNSQLDFTIPKDYWVNGQGKPIVNYEGSYDHLWTLEFGARQQGWTAYLNGMFGQGYGAEDIWLYNSSYDMDTDSVRGDVTITVKDKQTKWDTSINFPAATQLGTYMHKFFDSFEWWRLEPCFEDVKGEHVAMYDATGVSWYSAATIGNQTYVAYFYNKTTTTGKLVNLENGRTYTAKWYNPRTGEYTEIASNITGTGSKSYWNIPAKPDGSDWVLYATIN